MSFLDPQTDPDAQRVVPERADDEGIVFEQRRSIGQRVKRRLGATLAAIIAIAKWIPLLLTKFKFLTVMLTMFVSIAAYTIFWGWWFAVGFVAMLFVHEYGHVIALRREGVKATAPTFIPFLGAYIRMQGMPRDAAMEARVGLAGPIAGSLAALVPFGVYLATGNTFWQALAGIGFFLQLFNLLPVLPLDGGRAMAAISTKVWLLGFAAVVFLAFYTRYPLLFIVVLLGGFELLARWRVRNEPDRVAYHKVGWRQRLLIGASYFALVLITGFATVHLYKNLSISQATHHAKPGALAQATSSVSQLESDYRSRSGQWFTDPRALNEYANLDGGASVRVTVAPSARAVVLKSKASSISVPAGTELVTLSDAGRSEVIVLADHGVFTGSPA